MNVKLTTAQRRAMAILGGPGVAEAGGVLHWGHGVSHRTARALVRLELAEFVYQRQQRGERATRTVWAIRRTAAS
jgi:hypothetical protein